MPVMLQQHIIEIKSNCFYVIDLYVMSIVTLWAKQILNQHPHDLTDHQSLHLLDFSLDSCSYRLPCMHIIQSIDTYAKSQAMAT